jgi:putative Holliday junction resolvase
MSEQSRTILGFDYGQIRIGIAIGQELMASARPLVTLKTQQKVLLWETISRLIEEWRPALLVVGVPYHADGSTNAVTLAALRFSRQLNGRYHLPVDTIDEHLSSFAAEQLLKSSKSTKYRRNAKAYTDQMAAALILESWFNQQRNQ